MNQKEMEKLSTKELMEHEDFEVTGFQLFDVLDISKLESDNIMFNVMNRMIKSGGEITLTEFEVLELKRHGFIR